MDSPDEPAAATTMTTAGSQGDDSCALSPELVDFFVSLGATPEQIAEAEKGSALVGLGADLVFRASEGLTASDVAARAGTSVDSVLGIWRSLGVEVPDPEAPLFSTDDVNLVRTLSSVDLFSEDESDEVLHVVGSALARVADAAISFYVQSVESELSDSGADTLELAQKGSRAAQTALALGDGLGAVFVHLLRDGVARQRQAQFQVSDRALYRVAVGFVDLVGFTPLSHRMGSRELSAFIGQFENRAFQLAAENAGRIIKHIGDEVMFVAIDPVAGCALALDLMNEFSSDGIQPRGGLAYGDVVARQGDYYGDVVNLASRLADLAIPGEVLADDNVRRAAAGGPLEFEGAGRRQLKGFDKPVAVFSLRPAPGPAHAAQAVDTGANEATAVK
jgi:class 3 adenylate cyclase